MMHCFPIRPFLMMIVVLFLQTGTAYSAELDSSNTVLLDSLETVLRNDYQNCTSDTTPVSFNKLMEWRKSIDSVLARDDYAQLARSYQNETGLSSAKARPCEIVAWMNQLEIQLQEYSELLNKSSIRINHDREDSLFLEHELNRLIKGVYDFSGIPFGISQRAFMMLANSQKLPEYATESGFIRYDSLLYGIYPFKYAFHFSKDSLYWCYEIESASCSVDSLEIWARTMMLYMSAQFEKQCTVPPDHIYRVGHFDIVPGRLSIVRIWNFTDANAYFGLARQGNRFYAKAIVRRR